MKVPVLRIPFSGADSRFITSGLDEILKSGSLTMGNYTRRFEEMFAAFAQARYAISCNSGTAAIELILRGLGIEGKSVIVPTNTFLATALAVLHAGNRVVFADSEPSTFALDLEDVKRRVTADTAATILVHIGGVITPAVDEFQKLCKQRDIHLIEDCAHAHGCSIDGRQAGTLGRGGRSHFSPPRSSQRGKGAW